MTSKHTVVAWSGSEQSEQALDWAARRAYLCHESLQIVAAVESSLRRGRDLPDRLAAAADRVKWDFPDLEVRTAVVNETPVKALAEMSRDADLVVVGTPRGKGPHHFLGTTVSGGIAVHSHAPVAIIPPSAIASAPGDVVVGVDGSKLADATAMFAAAEALATGSTLRIVHVWHEPRLWLENDPWSDESFEQMRNEHTAVLKHVTAKIRKAFPDLQLTSTLSYGEVAEALDGIEPAPRLIAVGSRARSREAQTLLGTTAHALLANQSRPIMIFPITTAKQVATLSHTRGRDYQAANFRGMS